MLIALVILATDQGFQPVIFSSLGLNICYVFAAKYIGVLYHFLLYGYSIFVAGPQCSSFNQCYHWRFYTREIYMEIWDGVLLLATHF